MKGPNAVIINIAPVAGFLGVQPHSPYATSNADWIKQTKNLAAEWAKEVFRVNELILWFTETHLTEGMLRNDANVKDVLSRIPSKRFARVKGMATVIALLAMDASSYATGQNILRRVLQRSAQANMTL